jgi:hypothetical protein
MTISDTRRKSDLTCNQFRTAAKCGRCRTGCRIEASSEPCLESIIPSGAVTGGPEQSTYASINLHSEDHAIAPPTKSDVRMAPPSKV